MSESSVESFESVLPGFVEEMHESAAEPELESEPMHEAQPASLALSVDEFTALEERVLRAVNLVKRERMARVAAEEHARQLEAKLAEHTVLLNEHAVRLTEHLGQVDQLQAEVKSLRSERDHVRQRVERLLSQLDSLEI